MTDLKSASAVVLTVSIAIFSVALNAQPVEMIRRQTAEAADETGMQKTIELKFAAPKQGKAPKGKIILTQLKEKVRVEFEGDGLKPGSYIVFSASSCSDLKAGGMIAIKDLAGLGQELYRFETDSGNIMTEKSFDSFSLRKGDEKNISDKSIAFLQLSRTKATLLDCRTDEPATP